MNTVQTIIDNFEQAENKEAFIKALIEQDILTLKTEYINVHKKVEVFYANKPINDKSIQLPETIRKHMRYLRRMYPIISEIKPWQLGELHPLQH